MGGKPRKKIKKFKILDILMLTLFLTGFGAACYPFVSDALNDFLDQQVINYYQDKANRKNAAAVAEDKKQQEEKNKKLAEKGASPGASQFTKAVSEKKAKKKPDKTYLQKHTIAVLSIPKIRVELPVFDQTNDIFLQKGASLLEGTSFPIGGDNTHAVISAHRGLAKVKLFTDLPKLKVGDKFYIKVLKEKHAYQVDDIETIKPTNIHPLMIQKGKDLVTLMTCTPFMINSHRLLVTGHRVPYHAKADKEIKNVSFWHQHRIILWGTFIAFVFLLICVGLRKKFGKKR